MADKNEECDCPIVHRVERLENIVHGDGDTKLGLVGHQREISWKLNLIIAGLVMVIGALLLAFTNGLYKAATAPSQNVSQTVGSGAGDPPAIDYDSRQLAAMMGYSVREVQDRAAKGEIPGARKDGKEWRFDRAVIDAALAAKTADAAKAVSAAP